MNWSNFWKSKDEKEYEEFLMNPKEAYAKIKEEFKKMDAEVTQSRDTISALRTEVEEENLINEELEKAHTVVVTELNRSNSVDVTHLNNQISTLGSQVSVLTKTTADETRKLRVEYSQLETDLRTTLAAEYKTKYEGDKAKLETQYAHDLHTFYEEEGDKMKELIPSLVKETVGAFYEAHGTSTS